MRVLIATDRFPALSSAQAGAAMATAWAELRAQVAVVPMGNALEGFQPALADLLAGTTDVFANGTSVMEAQTSEGLVLGVRPEPASLQPAGMDPDASSVELGRTLYRTIEDARVRGPVSRVMLELGDLPIHDGGAGFLAALGATADHRLEAGVDALAGITSCDLGAVHEWLGATRLDLVVPAGQHTQHLVGLKGITSVRGHGIGLDPAILLALDQALVDLAEACGSSVLARTPGAGAAGGVGHAIMALGGRVGTGAEFCRDLAGLPDTMARADLVVTGGGRLDFGTMGGDVLAVVTQAATAALRPLVVVSQENFISARELRSIGIEAAYSVRPDGGDTTPVDEAELLAATRPVAATWTW